MRTVITLLGILFGASKAQSSNWILPSSFPAEEQLSYQGTRGPLLTNTLGGYLRSEPYQRSYIAANPTTGAFISAGTSRQPFEKFQLSRQRHVNFNPPMQQHVNFNPLRQQHMDFNPSRQQYIDFNPLRQQHIDLNPSRQQHIDFNPSRQQHGNFNPSRKPHMDFNPFRKQRGNFNPYEQQHINYGLTQQHMNPYGQQPINSYPYGQHLLREQHMDLNPRYVYQLPSIPKNNLYVIRIEYPDEPLFPLPIDSNLYHPQLSLRRNPSVRPKENKKKKMNNIDVHDLIGSDLAVTLFSAFNAALQNPDLYQNNILE